MSRPSKSWDHETAPQRAAEEKAAKEKAAQKKPAPRKKGPKKQGAPKKKGPKKQVAPKKKGPKKQGASEEKHRRHEALVVRYIWVRQTGKELPQHQQEIFWERPEVQRLSLFVGKGHADEVGTAARNVFEKTGELRVAAWLTEAERLIRSRE